MKEKEPVSSNTKQFTLRVLRVGWWALPAAHIGSAQEGGVILTKGRIHLSCVTA